MKKIKTIIIDDEKGSIDSLVWELENFKDSVEVVATCQSPKKAISLVNELHPELVFLDIQMPELSGFEFLDSFKYINFQVIFTTAHDEYAIKAFKVNAIDYLLKPIDEEELRMALSKIKKSQENQGFNQKIESIIEAVRQFDFESKVIMMPTIDGFEFIDIASIIRCESDSNYTYIHVENQKPLLVAKTLKEVEGMLSDKGFCRVHHSHLIGLRYIKKYNKGKQGIIVLKNGTEVPISRSKKKDFLKDV